MFLGYCWYLSLPICVIIGSVFFGGFLVAIVVTCNHQTEDILPTESQYCFSTDQFNTTRGVRCDNFVTEYLFGGMQYQLEHHLFPTMPRYYYPTLRPRIKAFAEENGLPFKVSGVWEIIRMNYNILRKHSGPLQENKFKNVCAMDCSPQTPNSPSTHSSNSSNK